MYTVQSDGANERPKE